MDKIDKDSDFNYQQMQKEYSKIFAPQINDYLSTLNSIITSVEINGFGMPLIMQNQIYLTLLEAKQILSTLSINKSIAPHNTPTNNSPLILLLNLNTLSIQLNKHSLKSPLYLLLNKTNNLILKCMDKILKYFSNNY